MDIRDKIAKWLELAVVILWFFVIGIALGIIGYSNEYFSDYFEKYKNIFLYLSLFFLFLSFLVKPKIIFFNFTIKRFFLILVSFCFGIFWYLKTTTTISPTHLLAKENGRYKFIDTDGSKNTIIYGTIVADPDIREDYTNIIIKPDVIISEPTKYTLEVDTTLAKVIVEKDYVVKVIDGDTFETKQGQKVRLLGVNAPEIGQPKADDATLFLKKKILNKEVELVIQEDYIFDIYGRVLAVVFIDKENINKLLVEEKLAEIYEDPNIRIIKKQQYGQKIKLKGNTGLIRAKVLPTIGDYYLQMNYGDYVKITSPLILPKKATNPAGFDFRKYLNARGIYATLKTLKNPQDIEFQGTGNLNIFIKISYILRKKLLLTIRKTVPYPESAFLGGVTLGYRGGVPQKIREEFQATGVAHVLALSGLHTGFIAALLLIVCNIFKLKSLLRFIVVSIALSMFVVMTGASPATIRAALMFCLGLFMYDVLKLSLRNSSRITIIIAACIILFFNPQLLPDASFVLSFMAVWALVYVSPFVEKILLYSNSKFIHQFLTFPLFSVIFGMTLVSLVGGILQEVSLVKKIFPFLLYLPQLDSLFPKWLNIEGSRWLYKGEFFLLSLTFYICGIVVHYLYSLSGKMLVKDMRSSSLFRGLIQFVSAQVAIQLGMMWPLSSVYFYRFPISGFYANFLAIPLIGLIVQLGWIAGLINLIFDIIAGILNLKLISSLGLNIALLINAFNDQLCQMFLGMAKTWGGFVPYPYVEMFGSDSLMLWYSILLFIIWFDKIRKFVEFYKIRAIIFFSFLFCFSLGYFLYPQIKKNKNLQIIFFDVNFGNAVLIRTPTKNILIDTGSSGSSGWSSAETVLAPTFTKYKIKNLDSVIITSLKPQCIGGAVYILSHFKTNKLYLPKNFLDCSNLTYYDFIEKQNLWYYTSNPYLYEVTSLFVENYKLSKYIRNFYGEIKIVSSSEEVVIDEVINNKSFKLVILSSEKIVNTQDVIGDNSLCVKIIYGNLSVLLPTQAGVKLQNKLVLDFADKLKSQILLVPQNGHYNSYDENFVKAVAPNLAVCQYGWTNQRIGYFYPSYVIPTQQKYNSLGIKFLRTDLTGAVIFNFGQEKYTYKTIISEEEYKTKIDFD